MIMDINIIIFMIVCVFSFSVLNCFNINFLVLNTILNIVGIMIIHGSNTNKKILLYILKNS